MESIFKGTHVRDNGKEKKWSIGRSELSVGSWNSAECQMTVLLLVVCSMMLISDFGWYLCVVVILADLKTWLMFWQTDHSWTGFTKHTFLQELDLHPVTLTYKLDVDIGKLYLLTERKCFVLVPLSSCSCGLQRPLQLPKWVLLLFRAGNIGWLTFAERNRWVFSLSGFANLSTKITTQREFRLSLIFCWAKTISNSAQRKLKWIPLSDFLITSVLHQLPI